MTAGRFSARSRTDTPAGGCELLHMNPEQWLEIITAEGKDLHWWQMALRAALLYLGALAVLRVGKKRLFGGNTAMDVVLGVMLGSVASRCLNGPATLFPTLGVTLALVAVHSISSKLAFFSPTVGALMKGEPRTLVRQGQMLREAMQKTDITEHDLEEALRAEGGMSELSKVEEARLERNGKISVVAKKEPPKVVEVKVENGVQTVRIEVG